ncbi:MAG: ATP-binding cassette domain-containing protein [Bacilli bacterium]|nr:ATP-binding cassette domain-containing protein [Bacilli bacterium]
MIRLENVVKHYRTTEAVNGVTLTINKGEIYGIIGYSGAGKSTLIRMINLLEKPTSGKLYVNEIDLLGLSPKELRLQRRKIGMIFQHFNLLSNKTVFDNVAFPLKIAKVKKDIIHNRVTELLNLVGVSSKANHYPSELSGGEKQRVGIARALANNPEVLLCDEVTSALDPETTKQILNLLKTINEKFGITIVLISHEMAVVKEICHRVAVMEKGKIIEEGLVISLFTSPQTKTAQNFVKQITDLNGDVLEDEKLKVKYPEGILVKLQYINDNVEKPLISSLVKMFDIDVNILQGKIIPTSNGSYGLLYVQLTGNDLSQAIKHLEKQGIEVKRID